MAKKRVAINGFGRIGRIVYRVNAEHDLVDIVAVNDLSPADVAAHLLKYDSTYGNFDGNVSVEGNELVVNGKRTKMYADRDPKKLPWKEDNIDIVLECTGVFRNREGAGQHLEAGARKVIISAPAQGEVDRTVVLGVNDRELTGKETVLSNASCTTNCLAPIVKVLNDAYGVQAGLLTTIHSYTNDQVILDQSHKDIRRARAGAINLIPTSTGAAEAVGLVIPELNGKLTGLAVRAPTPIVSLVDFVATLKNPPENAHAVNEALKKAAQGDLKNILHVSELPLVSSDFKGSEFSSVVDAEYTTLIDNLVKVIAWYDNEWAYSLRLLQVAAKC